MGGRTRVICLYCMALNQEIQLVNHSGDSYSTVGYDVTGEVPSELHPHGNPYPSWTTAEGPCWVASLDLSILILGGLSWYRIQ